MLKKIVSFIIPVALIASIMIGIQVYNKYQQRTESVSAGAFQSAIKEKLLRFHVRSNSDTFEDQSLKMAIRDDVLKFLGPKMNKCKTVEQSKKVARKYTKQIKKIAQREVKKWGKSYSVNVYIGKSEFPIKRYGDLVFPAGKYEALQIVLGKGKGQNWWCVMFPPLCLTDVVAGTVPYDSKKKLEKVIGSKYYVIIDPGSKKAHKAKVVGKFKIIEIFQKGEHIVSRWIGDK